MCVKAALEEVRRRRNFNQGYLCCQDLLGYCPHCSQKHLKMPNSIHGPKPVFLRKAKPITDILVSTHSVYIMQAFITAVE